MPCALYSGQERKLLRVATFLWCTRVDCWHGNCRGHPFVEGRATLCLHPLRYACPSGMHVRHPWRVHPGLLWRCLLKLEQRFKVATNTDAYGYRIAGW
eukprot:2630709-Amphidinium_carterae.1